MSTAYISHAHSVTKRFCQEHVRPEGSRRDSTVLKPGANETADAVLDSMFSQHLQTDEETGSSDLIKLAKRCRSYATSTVGFFECSMNSILRSVQKQDELAGRSRIGDLFKVVAAAECGVETLEAFDSGLHDMFPRIFRHFNSFLHRLLLSGAASAVPAATDACLSCLVQAMVASGESEIANVAIYDLLRRWIPSTAASSLPSRSVDVDNVNAANDTIVHCINFILDNTPRALNVLKRENRSSDASQETSSRPVAAFANTLPRVLMIALRHVALSSRDSAPANNLIKTLQKHRILEKDLQQTGSAWTQLATEAALVVRQALKKLMHEMRSHGSGQDAQTFELQRALELATSVFGWPWAYNDIICSILWQCLETVFEELTPEMDVSASEESALDARLRTIVMLIFRTARVAEGAANDARLSTTKGLANVRLHLHIVAKQLAAQQARGDCCLRQDTVMYFVHIVAQLYRPGFAHQAEISFPHYLPKEVQSWMSRSAYNTFASHLLFGDRNDAFPVSGSSTVPS